MTNEQFGSLIQRLSVIETMVAQSNRRLFGGDDGRGGEISMIKDRVGALEEGRWRWAVAGATIVLIVNFFTGSGQLSLTKLLAVMPH